MKQMLLHRFAIDRMLEDPILTRKDRLLIQSIYWPFEWFAQHAAGKKSLTPMLTSPTYKAGERGEVAVLDAARRTTSTAAASSRCS